MSIPQCYEHVRLGDFHNFNRCVYLQSPSLIRKPRCCKLESFIFDPSLLRDEIFQIACLDELKNFLPSNSYQPLNDYEWEVRRFVDIKDGVVNWFLMGKIIGFLHWMGVDDLHVHNMRFFKWKGEIVLFPIDIETMFNQHPLVSQCHLLPQARFLREGYGLQPLSLIIKNEDELEQLIKGYLETVDSLNDNHQNVRLKLSSAGNIKTAKFRIIVTPTSKYAEALEGGEGGQYFFKSEVEQLKRGDIPYFFTDFYHDKLYVYDKQMQPEAIHDVPLAKVHRGKGFFTECRLGEDCIKMSVCQLFKWGLLNGIEFNKKEVFKPLNKSSFLIQLDGRMKVTCVF